MAAAQTASATTTKATPEAEGAEKAQHRPKPKRRPRPNLNPDPNPNPNPNPYPNKAKSTGKATLESNLASLRVASMLAQITERAFMEHQLAARHFTFYNLCEHAPLSVCARRARACVCVCMCVCAPWTAPTALAAPH
eukprot:scaffold26529_cov66-Phaeocystis_antarctica.AAC.3